MDGVGWAVAPPGDCLMPSQPVWWEVGLEMQSGQWNSNPEFSEVARKLSPQICASLSLISACFNVRAKLRPTHTRFLVVSWQDPFLILHPPKNHQCEPVRGGWVGRGLP